MISLVDYLMGRDVTHPDDCTAEVRANAALTVARANALLDRFGSPRGVNSGWRPPAINAGIAGAAKRSKHMTGEAIDLADDDGRLDAYCLAHPEVLEQIGLWQEHPSATPRWCHVQTRPPRSGNRVFYP